MTKPITHVAFDMHQASTTAAWLRACGRSRWAPSGPQPARRESSAHVKGRQEDLFPS